jgi:hypothetical protein
MFRLARTVRTGMPILRSQKPSLGLRLSTDAGKTEAGKTEVDRKEVKRLVSGNYVFVLNIFVNVSNSFQN